MSFSKRFLILALLVIVLGAGGYLAFINFRHAAGSEDSASTGSEPTPEEATALPVKTESVRRGDLVIKLRSPGEAVTNRHIVIKAEVPGVVKPFNIDEGRHVRKGQSLIELDDEEYRLNLENAEASRLKVFSELLLEKRFNMPSGGISAADREKIAGGEREYNRVKELYKKGLIAREEYEEAQASYELTLIESGGKKDEVMAAAKGLTQAEISVKKARMELEKTRIQAPFAGIVFDIQVSPGEHVTAGRELLTLVNISRILVHARVLESEIGKIKVGREVTLKFSAYPGKSFQGKVNSVSPVVDSEDKTCKVIITVDNPEEAIKPGMHAEVEIDAEIHPGLLLIPQEAILNRSGKKLAFVVRDGLAKWEYIEVGLENEQFVEVIGNLKEGEPVIVEGHFTLAHDARVNIID